MTCSPATALTPSSQDLPSGYNSGEQYDTLSTGDMSGEAYELPDAREPVLATVEEISTSHNGSPLSHSQVAHIRHVPRSHV